MEKFSGLKTIGDGTYGSVVKAMNNKTGIKFNFDNHFYRRNCCNKENEEEILQMGCLHFFKGDSFFNEVSSSQYRLTI